MRLWVLMLSVLAAASPILAERIAGKVLDSTGKAVAGAVVVACDRATGVPIGPAGANPFADQAKGSQLAKVQQAVTDGAGTFSLDDLLAGEYRLVAQSWVEGVRVVDVTGVNARVIRLDGVAEKVVVPSPDALKVEIKPMGTGVVRMNLESANDELALLISTQPPQDAVLGIIAWKGQFLTHMIGYNRMPRGATTVQGLPEGEVWMSIWYFGRRSSMAELKFNLKAGQKIELNNNRVRLVPDPRGSNGLEPIPGERLRKVFTSLQKQENYKSAVAAIKENLTADQQKATGLGAMWDTPLDKEIELADGTKATLGDLLACMRYVSLRRQWKTLQEDK